MELNISLKYSLLVIIIFFTQRDSSGVQGSDTYTKQEKTLIQMLRPMVEKYLTLNYMKEDKFLVRFLRAKNHDLNSTREMLKKTYEWRTENRIDEILDEDWTRWERVLPYYLIVDKEGRPALASAIATVDFRRIFLGGLRPQLSRYIDYGLEKGVRNIHLVSNATGKEFVDGYIIFNLNGFNWKEHACVFCIPVWIDLIQHYELFYPLAVRRIIAVNGPRVFNNLLQLLKPFLSPPTAKGLEVYGIDRSEWKRVLLQSFSEEQLPLGFGGTRKH